MIDKYAFCIFSFISNEADTKSISANFEDNVLEIRINKSHETATKVIKIKSQE